MPRRPTALASEPGLPSPSADTPLSGGVPHGEAGATALNGQEKLGDFGDFETETRITSIDSLDSA